MGHTYIWPLPGHAVPVAVGPGHPGAFGAVRKHDVHTGVDLYAPEGQQVAAVEDGVVTAIDEFFTGGADTPLDEDGERIWLQTAAIFIEGASGVLLYGEVDVALGVYVGRKVHAGGTIGFVKRVLKPKKDGRPYGNPMNSPTMLHFERYAKGTTRAVFWNLGENRPDELHDPTSILLEASKSL
ncbi:MAG: hypothetical protein ABA06_04075 [Parcubacteria bacterium C7867-001]|nr:MAG: hypothetical protein ABA06_04075 [Parcubacteria bacterium C7867-001]